MNASRVGLWSNQATIWGASRSNAGARRSSHLEPSRTASRLPIGPWSNPATIGRIARRFPRQPLGLLRLPLCDGLDLSYKLGLIDVSGPFGHGPRLDRMHGAALEPIATLGEDDVPVALAFAHEEHVALPG